MPSSALTDELEVLAEHLPFDVWVRDRDDRCIYANACALRFWPDLLGKTPDDTTATADEKAIWRANNARARAGELVQGDVVYHHPTGERVVRNLIAPVVRDGAVIGTVGVNIDITAERDAVERARERGAIVSAVFDAAQALLGVREIVADDDILHVFDNQASRAVHGLMALEGVRDSELGVPKAMRERAVRLAREAARLGRPLDFEGRYAVAGRGDRMFRGKVAPLAPSAAGAERFLYFAEDVTELRTLSAELLRAERLASLGTLAASIAHEIKTPATAVLLNLKLARSAIAKLDVADAKALAEVLQMLDDAEAGTDHIARLVRDLAHLARPSDDRLEDLDVDETVRSATSLGRGALAASADLELDLGRAGHVRGSAVRLAQVVLNLMMNAGDALRTSGRRGRVVVRTRGLDGAARLEVEDDGPGIAEETRQYLFEPFLGASSGGSGLGLYVCRQIVDAHRGTIAALPREGGGTIVRVELPR